MLPLKVLLDARKINDGGIGTYIRNLVFACADNKEVEFSLLVSEPQKGINLEQIQVQAKPYSLSEYLSLGRSIDSRHFDLFHSPHFTLPFFLKCPSVITVHDTIHLSAPEKWYYPIIGSALIRSAVSRASKVILVSEASKADLFRHFPKLQNDSDKFSVIENALSREFLELETGNTEELPEDFILSVISQNKPHKGLKDLLDAYLSASSQIVLPKLVLAGFGVERFKQDNDLEKYEKAGIFFLGAVEADVLKSLYRQARALVVSSKIEGFGLTVLEAKSVGCRVMTRPLPSVIEMLDKDDQILSDFSLQSLEQGLKQLDLLIPKKAENVMNDGIISRYSQQNLAAKTIRTYLDAINYNK